MVRHDNLVAIAYKTGFCGSLLYYLLAHSNEVEQYQPLPSPTFSDGTSHEGTEFWFKNLHDYEEGITVRENLWSTYQTPESIKALQNSSKLVIFRCHPNIAYKLHFISNLKILFVTHNDPLLCERWAYEKVYKPAGEQFFLKTFKNFFKTQKTPKEISNIIKRRFLINNIQHDVVSLEKCKSLFQENLFNIKLEKILSKDYQHYVDVCRFLNITPIQSDFFNLIINNYWSKQWKRF